MLPSMTVMMIEVDLKPVALSYSRVAVVTATFSLHVQRSVSMVLSNITSTTTPLKPGAQFDCGNVKVIGFGIETRDC